MFHRETSGHRRHARTLVCTNTTESMIGIARTTTRDVKRWHNEGDMRRRWCAAGRLKAEKKVPRVRGHAQMPTPSPPSNVTPRPSHRHARLTSRHDNRYHHPRRLQQRTGHPPQTGRRARSTTQPSSGSLDAAATSPPAMLRNLGALPDTRRTGHRRGHPNRCLNPLTTRWGHPPHLPLDWQLRRGRSLESVDEKRGCTARCP